MYWDRAHLGEFAPFLYGKGLPSKKRIAGDVPVYGSNGIVGAHNQALLNEPVVIIGRKGSVGEVHLTSGPSWPIDTTFYAQSSNKADLDFLFYLLQTLPLKTNSDSAVPGLSRDYAHSLEVRVPNFVMQTAIGKVLKSLDFKIAHNSALSKTLEEIAQAIFKSWFVDFDPVKAKMAGEKPVGMDESTAALFPDSIQNTDSGMLPKGWWNSKINDVARVSYGAPFGSKLFNSVSNGVPLIRIRDLKNQSIATWTTEVHAKGFMTKAGDLLIGMDGEFNPTLWFGQNSWVNQRICRVEGKSSANSVFLFFCLIPIMRRIEHGSTGSTVIHLGKTDLDAIEIVNPGEALLARYKELTEPMLLMMANLALENHVMTEIRDGLLPRLISGELQIPEEMLVS